ncbi:four-carbon acid sugar kinase family protein [Nitratireductor basaltis]|uniref:Type III effector Hrp-dependent outer n=1 Tax=Nitratireductor basaltis TaxID=472175 RepID=A0A084U8N7_9HYPH|nr:four-carbon acid sugar kinase family protein [Nitratireductor basaltis]KFB09323.1 Type III effector Hrp-dependent outer [Nitratireductor basaltis]
MSRSFAEAEFSQAPWITWLGDDFTGSAAVMEALAFSGVPAVLFTQMPSAELLERFSHCRGIGLATTARSHTPQWMEAELPGLFEFLDRLGAPLLHYKICSTFDSSPAIGSIGKAAEIALSTIPSQVVPMVTAAPQMRRYQAFGHLFASTYDGVWRIDRHPVMSRHPVTPIADSDLLRHLSLQTKLQSGLIDLEALGGDAQQRLEELVDKGCRIVSIDSMDAKSEEAAGRLIWENRERAGLVLGSQGVEYALVRHWKRLGLLDEAPEPTGAGKVDRVAAVSGSVSPMTAAQLGRAEKDGFYLLAMDAGRLLGSQAEREAEEQRLVSEAVSAAEAGQSPLVYSAAGPDDPAVERFRNAVADRGFDTDEANEIVGTSLGRILDAILTHTRIRRAIISGGDTSGHALKALKLGALVALAPTIPGAALNKAYGDGAHDGLQIALKGGQMGTEDFFSWVRDGGGPR